MMHSRVSNHAHGARRREFRATERGHSRGEIATAGVRALRAGVPASELLQLSVCDASWPRALLGMASNDWQVLTFSRANRRADRSWCG
jgi:hypothetical protein